MMAYPSIRASNDMRYIGFSRKQTTRIKQIFNGRLGKLKLRSKVAVIPIILVEKG